MPKPISKLLIIRFSSFGDIIQALPAISAIKDHSTHAQVDWLVRSDFKDLVETHPGLTRTWSFERRSGLQGLLEVCRALSQENYTHIYDAHNNVRSHIVVNLLRLFHTLSFKAWPSLVRRPKSRLKRFLFFKFRLKVFPQPFRGALSFIEPLKKWGIESRMPAAPQLFIKSTSQKLPEKFIALAPSAAWPNKRWPVDHWKKLVPLLAPWPLVILGGPEDSFCEDIAAMAPEHATNLAGRISLSESCAVVKNAALTISADTGLLHVADQLGVKNIGLIGPTAFGYTSQPQSEILEVSLPCKPCSKDGRTPCINPIYQKCMKDILPEIVAQKTLKLVGPS